MPEAGEWLSLTAASEKLGVSVQTLRRRIKADQIPSRQVSSPYGPAWEVSLSNLDRVVNTDITDEGGSSTLDTELSGFDEGDSPTEQEAPLSPGMVEALQMIKELQQEVVARSEAAAAWQARAEMVSHQLSSIQLQLVEAQSTIKMLEAPKVEADPPETIESQEQSRPWWKGVWRSLW